MPAKNGKKSKNTHIILLADGTINIGISHTRKYIWHALFSVHVKKLKIIMQIKMFQTMFMKLKIMMVYNWI